MRIRKSLVSMTEGICHYCGGKYSKSGMARHLASCFERYRTLKEKAKKSANNVLNVEKRLNGFAWSVFIMMKDIIVKNVHLNMNAASK